MAANELQEALLKAVDYLATKRVEDLQADKTVLATVIKCTNAMTGEHKVSYNGGFMVAYAAEGKTYLPNTTVYIHVPLGDFSQKKTIAGNAQTLEDDNNISFVSSALSNYNLIGSNAISDVNNNYPIGVSSYLKEDYCLLYQRDPQTSFEHVDENGEIITDKDGNIITTEYEYTPLVDIDIETLENSIRDAEALLIEASFRTSLPKEHRLAANGTYGIQFILAFKDMDKPENENETKYVSYVLDNSDMTGSPYLFSQYSEQYNIYPIDAKNFKYIDSIMLFCKDFVSADTTPITGPTNTIFCKDLEIYGLRTITATNGEYKLQTGTPYGNTYSRVDEPDKQLTISANMIKGNSNLSDGVMFYWFVEDSRVTSTSESYQMYGGTGWRHLKGKGYTSNLVVTKDENTAYENKYLCVAVYRETMVLKEQIILYNQSNQLDITITSSLGQKFSGDRGTTTLTCEIDDKSEEKIDLENYWFVWSKVDDKSRTTLFNRTKEEVEQDYRDGIDQAISYATLQNLRAEIQSLEGVEFIVGENTLIYPAKNITTFAIFSCSVYRKPDFVDKGDIDKYDYMGMASIVLYNEATPTPQDYHIVIENGNQVFQYTESGVAPNNERFVDSERLQIYPLTAHFYDPSGTEVDTGVYSIKWEFPTTNSLLDISMDDASEVNPANDSLRWSYSSAFVFNIDQNYDYQATQNQVTAIVNYEGQEYRKDTDFFFTKIGDNGTNGTDVIAKISPVIEDSLLDEQPLTLVRRVNKEYQTVTWNDKWAVGTDAKLDNNNGDLKFQLFRRNMPLSGFKTAWTISGNRTKNSFIGSDNLGRNGNDDEILVIQNPSSLGKIKDENQNPIYQIIKASARLEDKDYCAFYGIPQIIYREPVEYKVNIDKKRLLQNILYSSNGYTPIYNKNLGTFINIVNANGGKVSKKIKISTYPSNADFKIGFAKNNSDDINTSLTISEEEENKDIGCYIYPNEFYSGLQTNNMVHFSIGEVNKTIEKEDKTSTIITVPEVEVYIPIYMSLNTHELASLNAWDGNSVEINEDDQYILAPQIGAGEKREIVKDPNKPTDDPNNRTNVFTGILMGVQQTPDADEKEQRKVGLFGYHAGEQSIFLDADTGNATFGRASDDDGIIEFRPGGTSKIGRWVFTKRDLFNGNLPAIKDEEGKEYYPPILKLDTYDSTDRKNEGLTTDEISQENYLDGQPLLPRDSQGVLINSDPGIISIKSRAVIDSDIAVDTNGNKKATQVLKKGDRIEVELAPNTLSAFTIYQHSTKTVQVDGKDKEVPYRYALAGILPTGQFYSNAMKSDRTTMALGPIAAFGEDVKENKVPYIGTLLAVEDPNDKSKNGGIIKIFKTNKDGDIDNTTYITADEYTSEYSRKLSLHGLEVSLYQAKGSGEKITPHHISVLNDYIELAHGNGENELFSLGGSKITNKTGISLLRTQKPFELSANGNILVSTNGTLTNNYKGTFSLTNTNTSGGSINITNGVETDNLSSKTVNLTTNSGNSLSLNTSVFTILMNQDNFSIQSKKNKNSLILLDNNAKQVSEIKTPFGLNITDYGSGNGILIKQASSKNIVLQTVAGTGNIKDSSELRLVPGNASNIGGQFSLSASGASLRGSNNAVDLGGTKYGGLNFSPGFTANWGYFPDKDSDGNSVNGVPYHTGTSILAERSIWTRQDLTAQGNCYFGTIVGQDGFDPQQYYMTIDRQGNIDTYGNINTRENLNVEKTITMNDIFYKVELSKSASSLNISEKSSSIWTHLNTIWDALGKAAPNATFSNDFYNKINGLYNGTEGWTYKNWKNTTEILYQINNNIAMIAYQIYRYIKYPELASAVAQSCRQYYKNLHNFSLSN